MRWLADECVEGPIVAALRAEGHGVTYVAELAPGLSDEEVLALAESSDAILLTADKDFGELVVRQQRCAHGVLLYRLHGRPDADKARLVVSAARHHGARLAGAFAVLTEQGLRIRPLTGPP